jgi:hypothetical protein
MLLRHPSVGSQWTGTFLSGDWVDLNSLVWYSSEPIVHAVLSVGQIQLATPC